MRYSDEQLAAIGPITAPLGSDLLVRIAVLTGGPGTGKSTVSREVMERWVREYGPGTVAALSPTGKAARRFREAAGHHAFTIHKALVRWEAEVDAAEEEAEYGSSVTDIPEVPGLPSRDVLAAVLVDEASMVDLRLARRLLRVLPATTRLLLVGDQDQLPSVGAGAFLRDVIACGAVSVHRLTEIHRQSKHSWIPVNAARINSGDAPTASPDSTDYFEVMCATKADVLAEVRKIVTAHPQVQVMVPVHRWEIGAQALNEVVREAINPARGREGWEAGAISFRRGDRVIHKRNNYRLGVMNGEIGVTTGIGSIRDENDREVQAMAVRYEDRTVHYTRKVAAAELRLAFALTVHSSQGSEYDEALVVVHSSHSYLLSRAILYTALTRAKKRVWIVGDKKGLSTAVRRNNPRERVTRLQERIREAVAAARKRAA